MQQRERETVTEERERKERDQEKKRHRGIFHSLAHHSDGREQPGPSQTEARTQELHPGLHRRDKGTNHLPKPFATAIPGIPQFGRIVGTGASRPIWDASIQGVAYTTSPDCCL